MLPLLIPLISAGISAATQLASSSNPGNAKAMRTLKGDIAKSEGLNNDEKAAMTNTAMAPVRATAGSVASEQGRLQAAGGGMAGGAATQQAQQLAARSLGMASERVGSRVAAADADALGAKKEELAQRQANATAQRNDTISGLASTAAGVASSAGQIQGATPGTFALGSDADYARMARMSGSATLSADEEVQVNALIARGISEQAARLAVINQRSA